MVLFVGLAESFCLCIFCLLLLLGIVVVDMLLDAPSSCLKQFENPRMRRDVTVSKSKKIYWKVKVFLS